jgi:hypothetical protein
MKRVIARGAHSSGVDDRNREMADAAEPRWLRGLDRHVLTRNNEAYRDRAIHAITCVLASEG